MAGERALQETREALVDWLRENPRFLPAAKEDLETLEDALEDARDEARHRVEAAKKEEAHELSEMLRGIPGEDAFAAHTALKRLQDAAPEPGRDPAHEVVTLPDPVPGFRGTLRPYQRRGAEFLLARGLHGILADEMGLGKTVTVIAAVLAADERALVVAPANVLYNWKDEIETFTGEEPAVYHLGELAGGPDARFLLTTYDQLRSLDADDDLVTGRPLLILDEAHYVRNPRTLRARLVRALPQERRVLLTGTPMVNDVEDYHELLRQVQPGRWGKRSEFRKQWLVDPQLFNKYPQVRRATAALLHRAASDVLLRRRKDDVLPDLPPRLVRVRRHELKPRALRKYRQLEARAEEALREGSDDEGTVFTHLHALRRHLAEARVPVILERVRELLAQGEPVVVYSEYLDPLHALAENLGDDAALIEGSTPLKERQEIANAFGEPGGPPVLLVQMEAGGVGLNFTAARHVLFVHFGWTPAAHAQAMDRVHRIGQDRPVVVEFFVTPDTLDERMARILLRKEADQNLVLADDADVHNRGQLVRALAKGAATRVEPEKAATARPQRL